MIYIRGIRAASLMEEIKALERACCGQSLSSHIEGPLEETFNREDKENESSSEWIPRWYVVIIFQNIILINILIVFLEATVFAKIDFFTTFNIISIQILNRLLNKMTDPDEDSKCMICQHVLYLRPAGCRRECIKTVLWVQSHGPLYQHRDLPLAS